MNICRNCIMFCKMLRSTLHLCDGRDSLEVQTHGDRGYVFEIETVLKVYSGNVRRCWLHHKLTRDDNVYLFNWCFLRLLSNFCILLNIFWTTNCSECSCMQWICACYQEIGIFPHTHTKHKFFPQISNRVDCLKQIRQIEHF